jgi:hypothetical protein
VKRAALALLLAGPAVAGERPSLEDFYERTRDRTEGFRDCVFGYCKDGVLLQALVGAQATNASADDLHPTLAEGLRLGGDAGLLFGERNVVRTRAWADLLRLQDSGRSITDLASQSTFFLTTSEPGQPGVHLSADLLLAQRTELEAEDFAELQLDPYRAADVELEVAPVGEKVDKDVFPAVPVGFGERVRWDRDGRRTESRRTESAALALRGFPNDRLSHYQLDAARATRVDWDTPAGAAHAWQASLGYQRLSPGIDELQIWLLFGWGWYDGANARNGFLAHAGAEVDLGEHQFGADDDARFTLDRATLRFRRVHHVRGYYRTTAVDRFRFGLLGEYVAVLDAGTLYALTPEAAVRPFRDLGLEVGARYRVLAVHDQRFPDESTDDRLELTADWLF